MEAIDVLWWWRAGAAKDGKWTCVVHVAFVWSHQQHCWLTACVAIALRIAKSSNNILSMPQEMQFTLPIYIVNLPTTDISQSNASQLGVKGQRGCPSLHAPDDHA